MIHDMNVSLTPWATSNAAISSASMIHDLNVSLIPWATGNAATSLKFLPRRSDVHHGNYNPSRKVKSNMQEDSDGPMTRARAKQLQRALTSQIGMIEISNQFEIGSRMLICLQLGT